MKALVGIGAWGRGLLRRRRSAGGLTGRSPANRADRKTKLAGLLAGLLLLRSLGLRKAVLHSEGLLLKRVPYEFPVEIFFTAFVNPEGGPIHFAGDAGYKCAEDRAIDRPSGLEQKERIGGLSVTGRAIQCGSNRRSAC